MGFAGKTYRVDFRSGGLNYNANIDATKATDMLLARNINLQNGGRESRGGTTKVSATAVTGAPRIMGMFDFQTTASGFQVFGTSNGKLYKNPTTTIKTGMSVVNKFSFDVFENELYICDGDTKPQTWDGSAASTSDITTPAADWTGSDQPFQCIAHGKGESRRMWYLYSDKVYYSSLGNGKEVSGGTSGYLQIDTGDGAGLVGGVEFGDRLIVFSRTKAFIIDDTDADVTNWGWQSTQWESGATHWRCIVKTPTDIVVMAADGEIYSVSAAQDYGDYKRASLTRPAFIDRWIDENVRLSYISDFHGVYDPELKAVRFFVVRNGETEVDTCLVCFTDRPVEEAWVVHDNTQSASGFSASCSAAVRESAGEYTVYTGDYAGFLWKLEQSSKNDDSNAYYAGFKTPYMHFDNPRITKRFTKLFVTVRPEGNFYLSVKVFVDGEFVGTDTISLSGAGGVFDTAVFDTDIFAGQDMREAKVDLGFRGKRIQLEIYNTNANEDFFVSSVLVDHKVLGGRPE